MPLMVVYWLDVPTWPEPKPTNAGINWAFYILSVLGSSWHSFTWSLSARGSFHSCYSTHQPKPTQPEHNLTWLVCTSTHQPNCNIQKQWQHGVVHLVGNPKYHLTAEGSIPDIPLFPHWWATLPLVWGSSSHICGLPFQLCGFLFPHVWATLGPRPFGWG